MYTHGKPMSYRQRRAIQLWLESGRKSKADALRRAGYSKAMYRQPHKFFDSPMVRAELDMLGYGTNGMGEREVKQSIVWKQKEPIQNKQTKMQDTQFNDVISALSKDDILKLQDVMGYAL